MSEPTNDRAQQINDLEAALKLSLPETVRRRLEAELSSLLTVSPLSLVASEGLQGSVTVGDDARINGVVVGINLGRIIYGRDPEEEERRRLVWYLDRLAAKLYRLPLRGLEERLDQGDGLALPHVYVTLATTNRHLFSIEKLPNDKFTGLTRYVNLTSDNKRSKEKFSIVSSYHTDWALPSTAITSFEEHLENKELHLFRQLLVTEAVQQHKRLVITGDPGSGKSTFVRYFAWALAQHGLDQSDTENRLFGWQDTNPTMPILVPVRKLAGRLARDGNSDTTVYKVLRDEIQSYNIENVDNLLTGALHSGAALLLLDGLDEVPLEGYQRVTSDRKVTLQAIRSFIQLYEHVRVVITCRTRAFDDNLRALLNWPFEAIAPFTLGQIRHFVPIWYRELHEKGQIDASQSHRLQLQLIDTIVNSNKLRDMAGSPLLLTMMALVLYNKGQLPRDRPQLYERILELLLGQWDKVHDGQSLSEAIGQPDWGSERIRPILDQLSFETHRQLSSEDGRGRVEKSVLRDALINFFEAANLPNSWGAAQHCLEYFEQRSGLLVPDGNDTYVFAHLTLQEHCAGRYMLRNKAAAKLVLKHSDDDRWHEPILLGLGVVQETNPSLIDRILGDLTDPYGENNQLKTPEQYYNHLMLASEIGVDREWDYMRAQQVNVDKLLRVLKEGLITLLSDPMQPLNVSKRIDVGFALGSYGDPRFPITSKEWREEINKARAGETSGYFCLIKPGVYIIGSDDVDLQADEDEKPQYKITVESPFWIARYPITNAQWNEWVNNGGRPGRFSHSENLNRHNQPVVGVTWKAAAEFCKWLSYQAGKTVRLPTEEEWEAAVRGGDARKYPWGDEWQKDCAATNDDQKVREWPFSVPVGCYPHGAAPCGALDMIGNVWEWTASRWYPYKNHQNQIFSTDRYVARGGHYRSIKRRARCAARFIPHSYFNFEFKGLRVVIGGGRLTW